MLPALKQLVVAASKFENLKSTSIGFEIYLTTFAEGGKNTLHKSGHFM